MSGRVDRCHLQSIDGAYFNTPTAMARKRVTGSELMARRTRDLGCIMRTGEKIMMILMK
jgi:hypothetical protein